MHSAAGTAAVASPIPVKVVVVTTFEDDYDNPNATGISPGEGVRWIKGFHLDTVVPLPAGFRPVRMNGDGVLELMTGMTTGKAAASTMALGLDPRFDLSKAYWILAGIAGVDPLQASLGSAAWAEWVVDGDIKNAVAPREIPGDWNFTRRAPKTSRSSIIRSLTMARSGSGRSMRPPLGAMSRWTRRWWVTT